jgi:hypothetical protein
MKRKFSAAIAALFGAVMAMGATAQADQLAEIKQKGTLVVGVKTAIRRGACVMRTAISSVWSQIWRRTLPSASA